MSPRSSQRVDRRRRVLVDESRLDDQRNTTPRIFRGDTDAPPCRYNSLALQSLNAPIVRYLPVRPYSMALWFLVGLLPIMALLTLHEWQPLLAPHPIHQTTSAFVLGTPGSLASWCSSVTFVTAAVVMLGIYSVRRHRRDDHRARFTVWRLGIVAAVLASVDSTTNIHQGARVLGYALGYESAADELWLGIWFIFFGGVIVRLLFEMASSKPAIGWMVAAGMAYLWSSFVELKIWNRSEHPLLECSQFAALLLGHHMVLFSLLSYARQIVLEALGVRVATVRRAGTAPTAQDAAAQDAAARDQLAGSTPPKLRTLTADPTPRPSQAKPVEKADSSPQLNVHDPDDAGPPDASKLSKAERRRLRKEKRKKAA